MANYKESLVNGLEWTRCFQIIINNPHAAQPSVIFNENRMLNVNNESIKLDSSSLSVEFDPTKIIDVYDPNTLTKTGATVTHGELYTLLFSAYMTEAAARDLREQTPPE